MYHSPSSFEQVAITNDEGYVKITMLNGDEFKYEDIEVVDGNYYGLYTEKSETIKILLAKDEIKEVQRQHNKSSWFFNLLGITVGVGSVFLAITMLGN